MAISSGNLQYEVREKKGKAGVTESIATLIRSKFSKKSGIVYCLSRAECDSTADDLRGYGIKAEAYHAGLTGLVTNSKLFLLAIAQSRSLWKNVCFTNAQSRSASVVFDTFLGPLRLDCHI